MKARLAGYERRADRLLAFFAKQLAAMPPRRERLLYLSGMSIVSFALWRTFCRGVFADYCSGVPNVAGGVSNLYMTPASFQEAAHIARCLAETSFNPAPLQNGQLQLKAIPEKDEPNWGDPLKFGRALQGVGVGPNQAAGQFLLAVVGGPNHLKLARDACAHPDGDVVAKLAALKPYYNSTTFRHPSDALVWEDPSSSDYAFIRWMEDSKIIARILVS